MIRVLVLGAGHQGAVIAETLSVNSYIDQVTVLDGDSSKFKQFEDNPKIVTLKMGVDDTEELSSTIEGFDLVSGALPSRFGFRSLSAAIDSRVNIVDTSFMPENPLILQDLAKESNVTVVPDCGVAPGLSNILVGHAFMQLDKVDEMHVAVGGLPQMPQPPLDYATTWSIRDLIEEYVRPARIVKNGREISVEALSGLEFVNIPGLGKLESFYTDGLRTLLHSMKGVKEMDERTLRYPGHVEKIRVLKDCAFFSEEPIMVNERSVTPKDFSAEVLSRMLVLKDARDLLVLQVQVIGEKEKEKMVIRYQLVDYYDEVWGVSSMSRATAYTNVAVCNLLLRGTLKEIGVIPPEKLGMNNVQFTAVISELNERGVKVEENSSSA